ncbi:1-(5-phosphoribosyl)-5-[(5-phosphoribosylamino)methylideneamino]imidazole-4-carboxamide isomerase [Selenomonas sp. oral taxon 136]|uniref:1-(5-phosphoribosyl)-5-[(5- phosphoribosylamino)methylideneamino]imidazole-4- carboxamide isomerase n=1 Tax=Selenomonas sp. oral taxon 136 TaxID=713030 RepID=UPI000767E2BE|nr:1-(5-phosphoribosyl)-5-[(5-phosphoribosylamino)methylideneamino]imidazole-4-carboxamide isomerase [Selenomonas sp. oral taxon 136]AME04590.1 1-(5-phosphoribosyl)-5-((5-phosphoribosylamino)methylideneamino)imidazole-4-carboxamide isomerase [Selenomonas sp. oral taxon 136]
MLILPAIDLRGGNCVRLIKGDFKQETIYSEHPEETALRWEGEDAEFLHVVDLDGALAGEPQNMDAIKRILQAVTIPIEVGGGIRSMESIDRLLSIGVSRVILGSVAVHKEELVQEACSTYGNRIVVGIDAKKGIVATDGWEKSGGISAVELAKKLGAFGLETIIYTDISRDGTLSGVNVTEAAHLARASGIKVIASGGVKSISDIEELKKRECDGIIGVIVGKSIYEGTLSLIEAISASR